MILPPDEAWSWHSYGTRIYASLIDAGVSFAQANYGDGEWSCILGRSGQNVNGEVYTEELGSALRKTLLDSQDYLYGFNPGRKLREDVETWISDHEVEVPWVYKDTFPAANVNGRLGPLLTVLRRRETLLVGPPHLSELPEEIIGAHDFLEVHPSRAWQDAGETSDRIREQASEGLVVLIAAGMATNLIVYDLWPYLKACTLLDMGACFDPYVGVKSRKHYRRPRWEGDARPMNLA